MEPNQPDQRIYSEAILGALIDEALAIAQQRSKLLDDLRKALLANAVGDALLLAARLVGIETEWLRRHPRKGK